MAGEYQKAYEESLNSPDTYWEKAAGNIEWYKKYEKVLDDSNKPFYRWFTGGELNTCYNALDYHVENGRAGQDALIYDSPVTGTKKKFSYKELTDYVAKFAGVLQSRGLSKGDTVIIYMPMIPEAVVSMLACARIGVVHSVVFGGFASNELAIRINDARPKLIISASCGIEAKRIIPYKPLLDEAIRLAEHKVEQCIIYQREEEKAELIEGHDFDWKGLMGNAKPVDPVPVKATDPLYILYTSGTTGIPKGVVRDNGGHAVALKHSMKMVYNIDPGDVYWAASDVGWVVGHSYIVYGPLLNGNTTILYEGKPVGTPDPGAFWRVISEYNVKVLFTAPTAFRAIKKEDPGGEYMKKYDLSGFGALFLAGERTDPDTYHWAHDLLGVPVIDHWWQTETAWSIAGNFMGLEEFPVKPGSPTRSAPGFNVQILDPDGKELGANQEGIVAVKLPLPPATLPTLWQNDQKYRESYLDPYPGYYFTGDGGYIDEDGYIYIMGRVDDVINVAGHRLSTGGMEEVIARHPDVAECAVVGAHDDLKGQLPVGFVVLKQGVTREGEEIISDVIRLVREQIGAVAAFKNATIVKRLPKTRSGKILRGTMRKIADGEDFKMPSTIDDPAILDEITADLKSIGYGKKN
jgi:propionyl-CoA synthetase